MLGKWRTKRLKLNRKSSAFAAGVAFIFLVFCVIWINDWIEKEFKGNRGSILKFEEAQTKKIVQQNKVLRSNVLPEGEVTRRANLDPNRGYWENVFFIKGEEIARFKNVEENIFDMKGAIPDGVVRFENVTAKTYGEEYYQEGKRHGLYREYYEKGELKREAVYGQGKLLMNKEYFIDGKLRMDEDFHDALMFVKNKEIGTGKVYYRNGVMMHEWHLTNMDENRYDKSYNIAGEMVEMNLYDREGKIIKTIKKSPKDSQETDIKPPDT